jgi:hypothetical protein
MTRMNCFGTKGHKRARLPAPALRSHFDASCEALPDVPWKAGTHTVGQTNARSRAAWTLAGSPVPCRTLAFEPRLFRPIRARFLASDPSGRHPVVAFCVGTRMAAERLTRLCTSPVIDVREWDLGSSAMEARILRPLVWFGLLESRTEPRSPTEVVDRRLYRKAPVFDRFVEFDVQIEGSGIRH